MTGDPPHIGAKDGQPPPPDGDALDIHRIDLAARLLLLKQPALSSESLIQQTSADLGVGVGAIDPALFIAGMTRVSGRTPTLDDQARARCIAARFAGLLSALADPADPADVTLLRDLQQRGQLGRPPLLTTQRRIRRACWNLPTVDLPDPTSAPHEPLPALAWDQLLDALARSLAYDRDGELWSDVALDGLDDRALASHRDRIRLAIARGERQAGPPRPPAPDASFESSALTTCAAASPAPESELLPAGHHVGRFTLLQRLGIGAMGVVYAAYDPELDRRIAVKLLRTRQGPGAQRAQARLLREAQAMGGLAHPNIVVVHDVGTHDGDVFVAMEFVRGATLQGWLQQQPRSWREVVEVFIQAGRGIAAAHAAGLVHRDFKPSNAMVGDDGRVRVLDFGLCYTNAVADRTGTAPTTLPPQTTAPSDLRITRREEVVGTPAYMPPEQFLRGGVVGPASDQFSFCASLYESLYGQLPFAGRTISEVTEAIARGDLRPPPRASRVPGWLYTVIQRGLRTDPQQRYPAMDVLLRALEPGRLRARSSVMVVAALALGVGVGGFWTARSHSADADPCSGAASQMSEVWGPEHRRSAEQALIAAGPAFADELWPRVSSELDRYAHAWQVSHRDACQAHRRGETSDTLLDRRMACLEQRRTALREAVTVLAEGQADVALHALEVVNLLPTLARCSDLAALEADLPPASDPHIHAAVDELRPRLERVQSLEHAGLSAAAQNLANEVLASAEKIGDRKLLAEALLQRGRLDINRNDLPAGQDNLLTRAYLEALGGRLDELATEALALRMYHRSRDNDQAPRALEDLAVAQEMLRRLPSSTPVGGLVLNNAGALYMARGDLTTAATMFREALKIREATLGPEHIEVANTLFNLALVSPPDQRMTLLARALEIFDRQLGDAHPQTLEVRLAASMFARDPRVARALIAPGCAALGRFTSDRVQQARCLFFLAHHAAEAGDSQAAASALADAIKLIPPDANDPAGSPDAVRLRASAALYTGEHSQAIALLRAQLGAQTGDEPWRRRQRAELELLLGLHLDRAGDRPAARIALTSAVDGLAASGSGDIVLQQRLASARVALATLILATDTAPERRQAASDLLRAAEQWYRGAGDGYAWRLDALAAARQTAALP